MILLLLLVCHMWVSAGNTNIWIEHAVCCCQVCPLPADHCAERTSCRNLLRSPCCWWPIICWGSSLVREVESMGITLRRRCGQLSERKHSIVTAQLRAGSSVFLGGGLHLWYCALRFYPSGPNHQNPEFCCNIFRQLREDVQWKRPDSSWKQCTFSPASTPSWVFSPKQHCITSAHPLFIRLSRPPSLLQAENAGQCFNTDPKIQNELQKVLNLLTENNFQARMLGGVYCCTWWLFQRRWC